MTLSRMCAALFLCMGLSGVTTLSSHAAISMDIQQVLQEERAWAGLTSKTLKVANGDTGTFLEWSYSEGGDKNKPTVLLVHGLSGSRDNWNRVARYLTPYYHVVIPDLPAHGDTKVPADFDLQMPNMVEALRRFTEAGGFNKNMHIAGHSLGGAISVLYTSLYFMDTQSLLLVDTAGVYEKTTSPYLKDPTLLRNMIVKQPGDFSKLLKIAMYTPPFIPAGLLKEQEQLMIKNSANTSKVIERLIELYGFYTPDTFRTALRAVEAPTQIIWGDKDVIIDVGVLPELTEHLKNEEPPVILKDIGHTPILEAEQLVIQHYLPFLQKAQATPNKFAGATH
jgi:pimeloyl-ACP methyl ester carboxylesterase